MSKILFIMSLAAGITLRCGKDSVDPDNNGVGANFAGVGEKWDG